ncbi:hypothetical protein SAMN05428949_1460 [Chitinophaga sp. YR627]|nr:hypothetical protein SAMN05428949_1460 [Chitinophaga sp. YR627]
MTRREYRVNTGFITGIVLQRGAMTGSRDKKDLMELAFCVQNVPPSGQLLKTTTI